MLFLQQPCYDLPVSTNNLVENLVNISPNPAREWIQVDGHQEGFKYLLISIVGKQNQIEINNNVIQLQGTVPGIYSLLIKNDKGILLSIEKLIVIE